MLKLPEAVLSAQDVVQMVGELREFSRWYAHEAVKRRTGAKQIAELPSVSPATSSIINQMPHADNLTKQDFDELIETLESYTKKAPMITITLAAPATMALKTSLTAWCRKNIAPNVLVTFQFNATILGGMVIRYGSRVFDWSFKRQILANRAAFPEVLGRV
jgi:F0F1-type ATP synthase delta subunit